MWRLKGRAETGTGRPQAAAEIPEGWISQLHKLPLKGKISTTCWAP